LDEEYLIPYHPIAKTQTKSLLAIPKKFHYPNIAESSSDFTNLHHERINEDRKVEYLHKFSQILQSVPKITHFDAEENNCELAVKAYTQDKHKIIYDLINFPELEINYGPKPEKVIASFVVLVVFLNNS
jgi:hypothetical protein